MSMASSIPLLAARDTKIRHVRRLARKKTLTIHELSGLEKDDGAVSSSSLLRTTGLGESNSIVERQTESLVR